MRLEPIEKPKNFMLMALYRYAKMRFGKVVTPLKVIYARYERKPMFLAVFSLFDLLVTKSVTLSSSFRLYV